MASEFGYITVTELENFTGYDYDSTHASLSSTLIEAQISQAERLINGYTGTTFTGTIPGPIKTCTLMIAQQLMKNILIDYGIISDRAPEQKRTTFLTSDIKQLLEPYKLEYGDDRTIWIYKRRSGNRTWW